MLFSTHPFGIHLLPSPYSTGVTPKVIKPYKCRSTSIPEGRKLCRLHKRERVYGVMARELCVAPAIDVQILVCYLHNSAIAARYDAVEDNLWTRFTTSPQLTKPNPVG